MQENDQYNFHLLLEEIKKNRTELKNCIEASEVRVLMKIEDLNERVKQLEKSNQQLQNRVEYLEQSSKKNSIIIYGLEVKEKYNIEHICNNFSRCLKIKIVPENINDFYWLTKLPKNPLKIDFVSNLKKREIFKNCKNLKGTNISISNDHTYIQRQENKILKQHLKAARQNKKNSYIKGNKLFIDGEVFTVETLKESDYIETTVNSLPSTPTINREIEEYFIDENEVIVKELPHQPTEEVKKMPKIKNTNQAQQKHVTCLHQVSKNIQINNSRERLRSHNK